MENARRSLVKAISWRIVGTVDTFVLTFIVTGKLVWAASVSALELCTKVLLFWLHERIWNKIKWGRE
jgi:uncharacterized membrane protein